MLVHRVVIKNYRSIADCDVTLCPVTFLVGPNGSGKSNFLDALSFVSDALNTSLDHAVTTRGGIAQVRRRAPAPAPNMPEEAVPVEIRLEFSLPSGASGNYSFRLRSFGGLVWVEHEECIVREPGAAPREQSFAVSDGVVRSSAPVSPAASKDRLYLVAASGLPAFRPVHDALSRMSFYHLEPARIAAVQPRSLGQRLEADGSNIASVLQRLEGEAPFVVGRIDEYMAALLPGFSCVDVRDLDPDLRVELCQQIPGFAGPVCFPAASMSDGTLRALAILVCLFQQGEPGVPLVGIEEPETALHPAALAVLLDAIREASAQRQVLVTSHSSDLLDNDEIDPNSILAVHWEESGMTRIAPLSDVGRGILRDGLSTVGELLRTGQLQPGSPAVEMPAGAGSR